MYTNVLSIDTCIITLSAIMNGYRSKKKTTLYMYVYI